MKSSRLALLLCVAWSVLPLGGPRAARGQATPAKKTDFSVIKEAWLARQKKYSAAKFVLVTDEKLSKLDSVLASDASRPDPATLAKLAKEYFGARQDVQLSISGIRMQYQASRMEPWPETPENKTFLSKTRSASDGNVSKLLMEKNEKLRYPAGNILANPRCDAETGIAYKPIVWTFGDLGVLALERPAVKPPTAETAVSSRPCLLVESSRGPLVESFWIDASRDYSILRYRTAFQGATETQLDCSYERSPGGCWVPVDWTATKFYAPKDIVSALIHVKVKEYVVNPTFAADEFSITFPPGTVVSDGRPAGGPRGGRVVDYLVKEDGSKRVITPAEAQASYETLLKTESGKAATPPAKRPSRWLWVAANCVLIALLGILFYIRRRSRLRET
jgi:hypothetical protein